MWLIRSGLVALWVIALPCSAWAQARPIELEWSAPDECPDASYLEAEVIRLLGDARIDDAMQVRGTIVREGDRLRLELWTARDGAEATRTIEGERCDALVDAGALVIAIAIDPDAILRARAGDPSRDADASASAEDAGVETATVTRASTVARVEASAEGEDDRDTPTPASEPIARFIAQAHATLGVGPLPYPSPGASIALGARFSMLELWAGGAFLGEQSTDNATFGLAYGRLRACVALPLGAIVELAPCAAIDVGALWGTGREIALARSGTSEWVAITPALDARFWITSAIGISISAELAIPLFVRRFTIEMAGGDPVVAFDPSPVAFLGGVGLVARVP